MPENQVHCPLVTHRFHLDRMWGDTDILTPNFKKFFEFFPESEDDSEGRQFEVYDGPKDISSEFNIGGWRRGCWSGNNGVFHGREW